MTNLGHRVLRAVSISVLAASSFACEAEDPEVKNPIGTGGNGGADVVTCDANEGVADMSGPMCAPLLDDYTPRDSASANDTWPACISDGNEYVRFDQNISSIARVNAFIQIGEILGFGGLKAPTPQEFLDARVIYSQEQGIESRVARREDEHYPPAPKLCRDMTPDEQAQYPDRCVGPVRIRPILNLAFEEGIKGNQPVINAARIEAALLWFLYASIYKEATTAAMNVLDTDSMWAKYTAGEPRENPMGLAKYIQARSQEAHDRIWDGLLAVRCWRDLDNPSGVSMDPVMHERARAQLDRALIRGMALILRQRVQVIECEPAWETVEILGGVLMREAQVRDPAQAAIFIEEVSKRRPDPVDKERLIGAIDALFPCP